MDPDEAPSPHHRASMDEYDPLYSSKLGRQQQPSGPPPSYSSSTSSSSSSLPTMTTDMAAADDLPAYTCGLHLEAVFDTKMETQDGPGRARSRQWRPTYAVLHGTALHLYRTKKVSWHGFSRVEEGPGVNADRPPWLKAGRLERSYTLAYADVGITTDYRKRSYAIRVHAEANQFLLACVELETLVAWLDALYAAMAVARPIDDMDFPSDMSVPRAQRERSLRRRLARQPSGDDDDDDEERQAVVAVEPPHHEDELVLPPGMAVRSRTRQQQRVSRDQDGDDDDEDAKWSPLHAWTARHDMAYAKLCYAVLLSESPRKSNLVVLKDRQWHVDWATGRMARGDPPRYGEEMEAGVVGPYGGFPGENMRI